MTEARGEGGDGRPLDEIIEALEAALMKGQVVVPAHVGIEGIRRVINAAKAAEYLAGEAHNQQEMAIHDPLTSLLTRRAFDVLLSEEISSLKIANRINDPCAVALLFIDADRFKKINDEFGHKAGDQALIRIAESIRRAVRSRDLIARIGGDEFAVALTLREEDPELVAGAVDDVVARIFANLDQANEQAVAGSREAFTASISIGVSILDRELASRYPDAQERLMHSADLAMYQAKLGLPAAQEPDAEA